MKIVYQKTLGFAYNYTGIFCLVYKHCPKYLWFQLNFGLV